MANTTTFSYTTDQYIQSYDPNALANPNATATDSIGGSTNPYSFQQYSFPADLHSNPTRSAHVLQININENNTVDISQIPQFVQNAGFNSLMNQSGPPDSRTAILSGSPTFGTTRMKGAIFLYIPSTVVFNNINQYADISLTSLGLGVAKGVLNIAAGLEGGLVGLVGAGSGAINNIANEFGDAASAGMALGGTPINPMVEVLFSNTPQREFMFDFLFAPSTKAETQSLYNIIKTLRYEAAPTPVDNVFWRAPSTFDLSFLHNGVENTSIPKIQECVLTQINVDYAPSGVWSTFTNGYPTTIRMTLFFRERHPNDRLQIGAGY